MALSFAISDSYFVNANHFSVRKNTVILFTFENDSAKPEDLLAGSPLKNDNYNLIIKI